MTDLSSTTRSLWNKAQGLGRQLAQVPILVYFVAYFALIFVFALIYTALPAESFFHPFVQYERDNFNKDAAVILNRIDQEVTEVFVQTYGSHITVVNGWTVDIDEVRFASLDVAAFPDRFAFHVIGPMWYFDPKDPDQPPIFAEDSWEVRVKQLQRVGIDDRLYFFVETDQGFIPKATGIPNTPGVKALFPFKFEDSTNISGNEAEFVIPEDTQGQALVTLPFSRDLIDQVNSFGQGYRGFPSAISGHFGRMLYFSAGIATASSTGDVVPLSALSRTLVTGQALAGLIVVALIINAVGVQLQWTVGHQDQDRLNAGEQQ